MEVLAAATNLTPAALGDCTPPVVLVEGHAMTMEPVE